MQGDAGRRALLVRSVYTDNDLGRRLGHEGYSYRYVWQAFAPLLARWARTEEVAGTTRDLAEAAARTRRAGQEPAHLSFLPLHLMDTIPGIANIAAVAWEYPDLPAIDVCGNPRNNWARAADSLDLVITHTHYSRAAFVRAGVRTPVRVVPIPIDPAYFAVGPHEPGRTTVVDCPCYVFPQPAGSAVRPPAPPDDPGGAGGLRGLCKKALALLPARLDKGLRRHVRAARLGLQRARAALRERDVRDLYPPRPQLELSGVVYTTILNPYDGRKNWADLLTGFVQALGEFADAQLVVKLVVSPQREADALAEAFACYRRAGLNHHCRVAFVTAYLSDEQLLRLAQGTTYYLNTSRAEGSCLPLQNFMAAGRPAVAPDHTGIADSLDAGCAFVVASHPEPTCWPLDLDGPSTTRWYRLVWQSLHDQIRSSYEVAHRDVGRYRALSEAGRARIRGLAHPESVWPLLAAALDEGVAGGRAVRRAG
jgi:glycosyltransferase involved in cell wall biosynthesis